MTTTTKLYPFSRKNIVKIAYYADKLEEKADILEQLAKYEESERLFNEVCSIRAMLHDTIGDKNALWLTGKQIALAKKILASA